jgi:hypothetical protein
MAGAGCAGSDDELASFRQAGLSLEYPDRWNVAGFSTTNSPHRVAVASFPLPSDAVEGDCGGLEVARRLPADGVFVLLIDYGDDMPARSRPEEFRLSEGKFANYECFGSSTAFRFGVGRHALQAHIGIGSNADQQLVDQALDVLGSIEATGDVPQS